MRFAWMRWLTRRVCQGSTRRGRLRRTGPATRLRLNCVSLEPRVLLSGGAIEGSLWYDLDADGVWDSTERPIADRVVYLDENDNGHRDDYELFSQTNSAGAYEITGAESKTYVIRQELPPRWFQTSPTVNQEPNVLVVNQHINQNRILEYTRTGDLVREIPIPAKNTESITNPRDLSVDAAGQIHVAQFAGDYISTFTPSLGTWEHQTSGVLYPGRSRIFIRGDFLYQSSIQFNIHDWTWEYFDSLDYVVDDITFGLDGKLYGWHNDHFGTGKPSVFVLNWDYTVQRHFEIGNLSGRHFKLLAIAVDQTGNIFAADDTGRVYRYDSTGQLTGSGLGSPHPVDINVSQDGYLVVGHSTGDVDIFAPDLTRVANFNVGNSNFTWVGFAGYRGGQPGVLPMEAGQLVKPLNLGSRIESPQLTLSLSSNHVDENVPNGTVVGSLTTGGDFREPITFSLVDSAQSRFAIVGNELQVANGSRLNYEGQSTYYVTIRAVDYFGVSLDKAFRIDILDVNEPPIAGAGGPYALRAGMSITLDGSGSDPDQSSDTLVYEWDLDDDGVFGESGAAAPRGDESLADPVFRAVGLVGPTTYPIALRVTDNGGLQNTASVNVRIDENKPPTAVAGGPYRVLDNRTKSLDASGSSDPEQSAAALIYEWDLDGDGIFGETGDDAARGDETGVHPVFAAAGLAAPFTLPLTLRVIDDGGLIDVDVAEILIAKNEPPTVATGGPYSLIRGETVTLDASGTSDLDQAADTLIYEWDLDADGVFGEVGAAAGRGDERGMHPVFSAAALTTRTTAPIALRITDDGGLIAEATTSVHVRLPSDPTLSNGELRIIGTNAADIITIGLPATGTEIEVDVNGERFPFPLRDVTSYFVDADAGNDSVTAAEDIRVRGYIRGGAGDDILNGGGGDEEIFGGDGNDRLNAGPGDDSVHGESGDDVLVASRGRDVLRAGSGNNSIQLGSFANSLRSISIEGPISENNSRKRRQPTAASNLTGQLSASLDAALSGSVSISVRDSSTGTIDGHPCTADLSVSASGPAKRLRFRGNLSGSVVVSCSGLGTVTGSVSGNVSGAISLQKGSASLRGAMEISFDGRRPSRSSIGGVAAISEAITDVL